MQTKSILLGILVGVGAARADPPAVLAPVEVTAQQNLNANYAAKRLTPQGYRLPTFVANLGVKHDFKGKRWSAVFTVSGLFDSLKDETRLDTPTLHDDAQRRRSARTFWAGLIWNFGNAKKGKTEALPFDNPS